MREWWKKVKGIVIVLGVIGVLLALFFVPSFSRVGYEVSLGELSEFAGKTKMTIYQEIVSDVFSNLKIAFSANFSSYWASLKLFALIYLLLIIFAIYKVSTRKEYENIEHGSADWCKPNEAYSVLSPKDGIVLAEKYYFPVNPEAPSGKNGNVLIIGGSGSRKISFLCNP